VDSGRPRLPPGALDYPDELLKELDYTVCSVHGAIAEQLQFVAALFSIPTAALEARGIPHVLVGSKSFHGREEIVSLRAALRAIEWPEASLSVYLRPCHADPGVAS
jgi:hypothetical protein